MQHYKRKLLLVIFVLIAAGLVLSGCAGNGGTGNGGQAGEQGDGDKVIKIGLNNWAENIAVSNMWKALLEEQGYTVELTDGDKVIIYAGVASGEFDLGMEVWLPTTDQPHWERFKDDLERFGPWYEGTRLGLVVPEYVDANKDQFVIEGKPSIVGIDAGSSLMRLTGDVVAEYGLDFNLIESSEPAVLASLKQAYAENQPVLVTLWSPHWAFAEFDLKYLEDPKNIYGDQENIYVMATKGFSEEHPEVARWLDTWHMDDQSLGSLMSTINEHGDPLEGAKIWIENNRDLVEVWLK